MWNQPSMYDSRHLSVSHSHEKPSKHETIHFYSEDEVHPGLRQRQPRYISPPANCSHPSNSYVTSTPEYIGRQLHFSSSDDSGVQSDLWTDISSPLKELHSKWQRSNKGLYDTTVPETLLEKISQLLPFIIGLIVLSGAVYSVQVAMNSSRDVAHARGKYAAILYAHRRVYNSTNPTRRPLGEIMDEDGNVLSGKRAAIQFSYNRQNAKNNKKDVVELSGKEEKKETIQVETQSIKTQMEKKTKVLKKVASFGHFASTKVNENEMVSSQPGRVIRRKAPEDTSSVETATPKPKKSAVLEPMEFDDDDKQGKVSTTSPPPKPKVSVKAPEPRTPNKPLTRLIEQS